MNLMRLGLGTLAAAALVLSLNTVTVTTAGAEIIILGRGGNQDNPGQGNQNGRRPPEERPMPGHGMGDGQGNANGHSPDRQKGPDLGKLFDKCPAEFVVDDLGTEMGDLMKVWHKDKNLRAYPIVTGVVQDVTGTTFSMLGGSVVVDASMSLISQPCWRPSSATDEAGNRVLPLLPGDKVYVRGRLQSDGTIAARYVRIHVPETDGILTGVVQLADTGLFIVNGEAVVIDDLSLILKACGCEITTIQAGDSVRAHVNVVDTDGDGEPELYAVFARVLHPATPNRPDKDDDDDDDNDDDDDDDNDDTNDDTNDDDNSGLDL